MVLTTPSTANTNPEDGHTFDVVFTEDFCNGLKSGDTIVVYYNATLNDNAVVKEAENNKAYLEYLDAVVEYLDKYMKD